MRYIAVRKLYETGEASSVKFEPEFQQGDGRIDLVLVQGREEYAFELKRWQVKAQKEKILKKDYPKLVSFVKAGANRHAYEVIFGVNEDKCMGEDFHRDRVEFNKKAFSEDLGAKFNLCQCEVMRFDGFTPCAMLTTPNLDASGE